jgi:hypothetical protein
LYGKHLNHSLLSEYLVSSRLFKWVNEFKKEEDYGQGKIKRIVENNNNISENKKF